ncbi:MAG: hypothetical protein MUC48_22665 [Leptolyngbya sp. Prado105]|jgi:hypothetical protein|nr:hypothetical protein [Leptolyngbya sp. Prado105]
MKNVSTLIWAVFFLLILPLVGYTVYSGLIVGEMELPGGFKVTFREKPKSTTDSKLGELSKEELEKRQTALEKRFKELEQQANRSQSPPQVQPINLSGTWYAPSGLSYQIVQNGNFMAIQEFNPTYGITAIGRGQIQGQTVLINYQTAAYTQGIGNLTISPDGRALNGFFRDNYSGYTVPASLNR